MAVLAGTGQRPQTGLARLLARLTATKKADCDYSDTELTELTKLVSYIRALEQRVELLQVVFNDSNQDQRQRNARSLVAVLDP